MQSHLAWSNIIFEATGVRIILTKTKTIQCSERNLQFFIPRHSNQSVCLYTQLIAWKASSPCSRPSDPVFVVPSRGNWVPLNRNLADPVYKAALAAAGVTPSEYGWSSFRRGGATMGFLATGDVESLREHGDWKSNAYIKYLSLPASRRKHIVAALQHVLD